MTKLSVNVNKICTLRNTRPNLNIPDLLHLSKIALDSGAHGLTVHPRPDHRHIKPADVPALASLLTHYPGREFNIEGNPFHDYMHYARDLRPFGDPAGAFTLGNLADGSNPLPTVGTNGSFYPPFPARVAANPDVSTIIPGMRRVKNVEANLGISDGKALSPELMARLRKHRWVRTYFVP